MKTKKNYIKLIVLILGTVLITLLICNLYRNYDGNKANTSYISKYVSVVYYNELPNYITELSSNSLLYVSYIGDKDIYNLEKQMKKVLKNTNLEDNFTYLDVTENIGENKTILGFNKNVGIVDTKVIKFPAIIYFKDSVPIDYIDSTDGLFDAGKLTQLIEKYELESDMNA